jgi:hypothetical protein
MSTRSNIARTLAGALSIAALAAPAALARPAGPDAPAGTTPPARIVQNLRTPDAQDAASQVAQRAGGAAAQGRYYASYGKPTPIQQPDRSVSADDGTPWMAIAAGFAALLILVGSVTLAGRAFMRTRRAGATV